MVKFVIVQSSSTGGSYMEHVIHKSETHVQKYVLCEYSSFLDNENIDKMCTYNVDNKRKNELLMYVNTNCEHCNKKKCDKWIHSVPINKDNVDMFNEDEIDFLFNYFFDGSETTKGEQRSWAYNERYTIEIELYSTPKFKNLTKEENK